MQIDLRIAKERLHTLDRRKSSRMQFRNGAGIGQRKEFFSSGRRVFVDQDILEGVSQCNPSSGKLGSGCLLLLPLGELLAKLFLEALDAACRIDKLLLAGKERMAIRADFNAKRIARRGRAGFKLVSAAGTVDRHGMVIRMDSFFHSSFLLGRRFLPYPIIG